MNILWSGTFWLMSLPVHRHLPLVQINQNHKKHLQKQQIPEEEEKLRRICFVCFDLCCWAVGCHNKFCRTLVTMYKMAKKWPKSISEFKLSIFSSFAQFLVLSVTFFLFSTVITATLLIWRYETRRIQYIQTERWNKIFESIFLSAAVWW